jgi:hypothetical protein
MSQGREKVVSRVRSNVLINNPFYVWVPPEEGPEISTGSKASSAFGN